MRYTAIGGNRGGPVEFLPYSMTKRTIERRNLGSVSTFRKSTEPKQLDSADSGLDWVWQRGASKVVELGKMKVSYSE